MKGEQKKWRVVVAGLLLVFVLGVGASEEGDLVAQCNLLVQKVLPCLSFATGQAAVPTKECCSATLEIKKSDPKCLCFAIQQTHKGIPEAKSMGIQEGRLLQLPSACNLKNASTTDCPSTFLHFHFLIQHLYCDIHLHLFYANCKNKITIKEMNFYKFFKKNIHIYI